MICNQLANKLLGMQPQNFALMIVEENNGRFMNSQMTRYFYGIDEYFSEIMCNGEGSLFEELDIDELAELSMEQIEEDFKNYCNATAMKMFEFNKEGE